MKRRTYLGFTAGSLLGLSEFTNIAKSQIIGEIDLNTEVNVSNDSGKISELILHISDINIEPRNISENIKLSIYAYHNSTEFKVSETVKEPNNLDSSDFDREFLVSNLFNESTLADEKSISKEAFFAEETGDTQTNNIDVKLKVESPFEDSLSKQTTTINISNIETEFETVESDLLYHYNISETDINNEPDVSENSFDGERNNLGVNNNLPSFDGNSSYIDVPTDAHNNLTTELSISAWIKTDDIGTFLSEINDTDDFILLRTSDQYPDFRLAINDNRVGLNFNTDIEDDEWYHICGTYSNENGLKLYVNGEIDSQDSDERFEQEFNLGRQRVSVGRDSRSGSSSGRYLEGNIVNVQVYSSELTETQVDVLYNDFKQNWI